MATIIRKDSAQRPALGRGVGEIAFSFADMRGQADEYLKTVQKEAAKIVQQAHQQAEQIRRQAEIAGRKAAEAAAEQVLDEKVARRMDTLLPTLDHLVEQINDTKGELQSHWERCMLRVATAIAERVVRRELSARPEIALEAIAEALRLATGSADITVRISPTDHQNLGPQIQRLAESICHLNPSEIIPDPAITPGGCRVETQYGVIDQQIESQLRRIEQDLE